MEDQYRYFDVIPLDPKPAKRTINYKKKRAARLHRKRVKRQRRAM